MVKKFLLGLIIPCLVWLPVDAMLEPSASESSETARCHRPSFQAQKVFPTVKEAILALESLAFKNKEPAEAQKFVKGIFEDPNDSLSWSIEELNEGGRFRISSDDRLIDFLNFSFAAEEIYRGKKKKNTSDIREWNSLLRPLDIVLDPLRVAEHEIRESFITNRGDPESRGESLRNLKTIGRIFSAQYEFHCTLSHQLYSSFGAPKTLQDQLLHKKSLQILNAQAFKASSFVSAVLCTIHFKDRSEGHERLIGNSYLLMQRAMDYVMGYKALSAEVLDLEFRIAPKGLEDRKKMEVESQMLCRALHLSALNLWGNTVLYGGRKDWDAEFQREYEDYKSQVALSKKRGPKTISKEKKGVPTKMATADLRAKKPKIDSQLDLPQGAQAGRKSVPSSAYVPFKDEGPSREAEREAKEVRHRQREQVRQTLREIREAQGFSVEENARQESILLQNDNEDPLEPEIQPIEALLNLTALQKRVIEAVRTNSWRFTKDDWANCLLGFGYKKDERSGGSHANMIPPKIFRLFHPLSGTEYQANALEWHQKFPTYGFNYLGATLRGDWGNVLELRYFRAQIRELIHSLGLLFTLAHGEIEPQKIEAAS